MSWPGGGGAWWRAVLTMTRTLSHLSTWASPKAVRLDAQAVLGGEGSRLLLFLCVGGLCPTARPCVCIPACLECRLDSFLYNTYRPCCPWNVNSSSALQC